VDPRHAEILRRCAEAVDLGATQIMFQGGHNPDSDRVLRAPLLDGQSAYPQLALPLARRE
jgi:cyclic dehypoxanthinyl futalosine synthase